MRKEEKGTVRKNFRLEERVNDLLVEYAEDHHLTQNQVLNFIIRTYLESEKVKKIQIYGSDQ